MTWLVSGLKSAQNEDKKLNNPKFGTARAPVFGLFQRCVRLWIIGFPLSFKHINAVLELPEKSMAEKLVLLVLANHANEKGFCWPSYATLARECSMDRRSVMRVMVKLKASGLVRRERRFPSNGYYLLVTKGHQVRKQVVTGTTPLVTKSALAGDCRSPKPSVPLTKPASLRDQNGVNQEKPAWKQGIDDFYASVR